MEGKKTRPWWTKGVDISYRLHAFLVRRFLEPQVAKVGLTCNPVDPGVWWRGADPPRPGSRVTRLQ